MRSNGRREEKATTEMKKKNPKNEEKEEPEIVMIPSSSSSEEPEKQEEEVQSDNEEEEEEVKSSNNSNQNMNEEEEESMEEDVEEEEEKKEDIKKKGKKNLSNGSVVPTSSCRFPTNRIQKIVRSEGSDFRITQEAILLINKSTEQFLEQLCEDAYANVVKDRKKAVAYKHLSSVISKTKRYDFLSDFVPEKIKAEDALAERTLAGA